MEFNPEEIYKSFINKKIDRSTLIDHLISIIEISAKVHWRIKSIHILSDLNAKSQRLFKLIENLAISDSNEYVRFTALKYIQENFIEYALEPMKWAYYHEKALQCLFVILKTLSKIDNPLSREFLISTLISINNQAFKDDIELILKNNKISNYQNNQIAEIVIDYLIITNLEENYGHIDYKVRDCRINELDLSDISSHVFGWNAIKKFPNFITELKNLTTLNLKFNRLTYLPKIIGKMVNLNGQYQFPSKFKKLKDFLKLRCKLT